VPESQRLSEDDCAMSQPEDIMAKLGSFAERIRAKFGNFAERIRAKLETSPNETLLRPTFPNI